MSPSPSSPLIAVVGATGQQGGSVARTFLSHNYRVRAITRNPSSSSALALQDLGAEPARADLDDPASLRVAFDGADVIFGVTDFWQFVGDEGTRRAAEEK